MYVCLYVNAKKQKKKKKKSFKIYSFSHDILLKVQVKLTCTMIKITNDILLYPGTPNSKCYNALIQRF